MKKIALYCFVILIVSSVGHSQMKLQLFSEMGNVQQVSSSSNILETNLKLELHPTIKMSSIDKNLSEASWLIGILLDVSLPGGDLENKLETGYSGHFYAGYFVSTTFFLSLRIGYIKFGNGLKEDDFAKFEFEQSYVPLLFGIYYIFETGGAFRPYIGLALGPMMQSYSKKFTFKFDNSIYNDSSTELTFGLVSELGFYYLVASTTMIQLGVSYSIAGSDLGGEWNIGSYLSFLGGVSFALGGD